MSEPQTTESTPAASPPVAAPVPFLQSSEEQAAKIRRQLERMFQDLRLVHDVVEVCSSASAEELNDGVDNVLRCHVLNPLHDMMKRVTHLAERFGGKTEMSETGDKE